MTSDPRSESRIHPVTLPPQMSQREREEFIQGLGILEGILERLAELDLDRRIDRHEAMGR